MKTERRHELQTNELATWLTGCIETFKPYSKAITGGLVLLATLWGAYAYITYNGNRNQAVAWSELFLAYDQEAQSDRFAEVAEMHSDTEAGLWALQSAADVNLFQGNQDLFGDREQAKEELQQAKEAYALVSERTSDPLLKQRAVFGAAQAMESMGEFGPAEEKYRDVAEQWPEAGVGQLAQRRLEMLQQPATREWYSWFADQQPDPSPLLDPSLFSDLPNLPDAPDISLPEPGELLKPSGESPGDGDEPAMDGLPLKLNLHDSLPPNLEGSATPPADVPPSDVPPSDVPPGDDSAAPEPSAPEGTAPEEPTPEAPTAEGSPPEESTPGEPATEGESAETRPPTDAADTP